MSVKEKLLNWVMDEVINVGKKFLCSGKEKQKEKDRVLGGGWSAITALLCMIEVEAPQDYLKCLVEKDREGYFQGDASEYETELFKNSRRLQEYYISHRAFFKSLKGMEDKYRAFAGYLKKKEESERLKEDYLLESEGFRKNLREWKNVLEKL